MCLHTRACIPPPQHPHTPHPIQHTHTRAEGSRERSRTTNSFNFPCLPFRVTSIFASPEFNTNIALKFTRRHNSWNTFPRLTQLSINSKGQLQTCPTRGSKAPDSPGTRRPTQPRPFPSGGLRSVTRRHTCTYVTCFPRTDDFNYQYFLFVLYSGITSSPFFFRSSRRASSSL